MLCALAVLLSACSSLRFGYNQAPTLGYWWLDRYVDFDEAQAPLVRDALSDWFAWHRRTQLPDYAALLARAEAEALNDITAERACAWWGDVSRRMDTALDQVIPAAAALLPTLTPAQVTQIESRYVEVNADYRDDFMQTDREKRLKESVKRGIERADNLYGKLDDAQRALVARMTAESPFDAELWLAERQRRQQESLQLLRKVNTEGNGREQAQAALRSYFDHLRHSPRDEYRRYAERLTQFNCGYTASLHNSTTPAQRQVAIQKLKGWEADLRALASDAP